MSITYRDIKTQPHYQIHITYNNCKECKTNVLYFDVAAVSVYFEDFIGLIKFLYVCYYSSSYVTNYQHIKGNWFDRCDKYIKNTTCGDDENDKTMFINENDWTMSMNIYGCFEKMLPLTIMNNYIIDNMKFYYVESNCQFRIPIINFTEEDVQGILSAIEDSIKNCESCEFRSESFWKNNNIGIDLKYEIPKHYDDDIHTKFLITSQKAIIEHRYKRVRGDI